jgi:hypothetical protein
MAADQSDFASGLRRTFSDQALMLDLTCVPGQCSFLPPLADAWIMSVDFAEKVKVLYGQPIEELIGIESACSRRKARTVISRGAPPSERGDEPNIT